MKYHIFELSAHSGGPWISKTCSSLKVLEKLLNSFSKLPTNREFGYYKIKMNRSIKIFLNKHLFTTSQVVLSWPETMSEFTYNKMLISRTAFDNFPLDGDKLQNTF